MTKDKEREIQERAKAKGKERNKQEMGKEETPCKQRHASAAVAWATERRSARRLRPRFLPFTMDKRTTTTRASAWGESWGDSSAYWQGDHCCWSCADEWNTSPSTGLRAAMMAILFEEYDFRHH